MRLKFSGCLATSRTMKMFALFLALVCSVVAAPPTKPTGNAAAPKVEKDITPLLTSATWKWDHPTVKGRTLKFRKDGTCESNIWKGVWKVTAPLHVEIVMDGNRKMELDFKEDLTGFTGKHPDGGDVVGVRLGEVPAGLK
jgi:hypothetical protein